MVGFDLRKLLISQLRAIAQTTCDSVTSLISLKYRGQTVPSYLINCQQGLTVESETWRMSHSCSLLLLLLLFWYYKDFFHEMLGTENNILDCFHIFFEYILYCVCERERTVQIFKRLKSICLVSESQRKISIQTESNSLLNANGTDREREHMEVLSHICRTHQRWDCV